MLKVFIPREREEGEARVAATPESVRRYVKEGLEVVVEAGAGAGAHIPDADFEAAGASVAPDAAAAWGGADLVLKVKPPSLDEAKAMKAGSLLVSFVAPHRNHDLLRQLGAQGVSVAAMELIPRITRAQKMDALSSQASIGGYKAVLLAAGLLPRYFPLLMTAAGTIKPAKVVIMGAGVAGLQAIATAKRLGAVVEVSDIRAEVKEQVQSLGGRFIELPDMQADSQGSGGYAKAVTPEFLAKQQAIVAEHVKAADVVITTALVPGRPAPKLVTAAMVESMRPGSVIVDMAVEAGGNCELSELGETIERHGVTIVGHPNLPATMAFDASALYARNLLELVLVTLGEGALKIDLEDEVLDGAILLHEGAVRHAPTRDAMERSES